MEIYSGAQRQEDEGRVEYGIPDRSARSELPGLPLDMDW